MSDYRGSQIRWWRRREWPAARGSAGTCCRRRSRRETGCRAVRSRRTRPLATDRTGTADRPRAVAPLRSRAAAGGAHAAGSGTCRRRATHAAPMSAPRPRNRTTAQHNDMGYRLHLNRSTNHILCHSNSQNSPEKSEILC